MRDPCGIYVIHQFFMRISSVDVRRCASHTRPLRGVRDFGFELFKTFECAQFMRVFWDVRSLCVFHARCLRKSSVNHQYLCVIYKWYVRRRLDIGPTSTRVDRHPANPTTTVNVGPISIRRWPRQLDIGPTSTRVDRHPANSTTTVDVGPISIRHWCRQMDIGPTSNTMGGVVPISIRRWRRRLDIGPTSTRVDSHPANTTITVDVGPISIRH